ncbi:hypothetical protein [Hydrogenophaga sp. PAMC20947]|uniref:hypothetical protein n=1 Tax=Hydrogenophaga sp. PAMC20947 TaxID=2565558 RepID=UPI00109DBB07|nr:hypothetical protein [Hydrogenophaga sp. PAMC20947]QCB46629.1 hypothetical protein E5678_11695 [Hydrogenophaga sp. PAMC20947]
MSLTTRLAVVAETQEHLIRHLEAIEEPFPVESKGWREVVFMHPPGHPERGDLRLPRLGMAYCAMVEERYTGRDHYAVKLFHRCLQILERGSLTPQDLVMFGVEYTGMAGVESLSRSLAGSRKREARPKPLLHQRLYAEHRQHPGEALDELLGHLLNKGVVTSFDVDSARCGRVQWEGQDGRHETPRSTVRGWFTAFNKLR